MDRIIINTAEEFPHLPKAPIVESVIDIRSVAATTFDEEALRAAVEPRLPGYHFLDAPREFRQEFRVGVGVAPEQNFQDLGLKGLRFQNEDQKQIVQFNRDGYVFSRLEPYRNWAEFVGEGLHHWQSYREVAQPGEVNRIGLRFINRIQLPVNEVRFEDYVQPAPVPPRGLELPFHGYMHQETLAVPGYNYAINVVRTIQLPQPDSTTGLGLILDIDVFTTHGFDLDEGRVIQCLQEMRWLKDKVFFGSVTPKALELFQ